MVYAFTEFICCFNLFSYSLMLSKLSEFTLSLDFTDSTIGLTFYDIFLLNYLSTFYYNLLISSPLNCSKTSANYLLLINSSYLGLLM